MPIFNVLTAVIELVEADTEQEAIAIMYARLTGDGYDTFENAHYDGILPSAFESEELDDATLDAVRQSARPSPVEIPVKGWM